MIQRCKGNSLDAMPRMIIMCCLAVFCLATTGTGENINGQDTHNALELFRVHNVRHALDEGVQLGSSHATLAASGQWIDVSWRGVQDPQDDDYIALYAPANVSVYHTSPIKYKWAVSAPSHRKEGAGTVRYSAPQCKHARIQPQIVQAFTPQLLVVSNVYSACHSCRFRLINLRTDVRLAFMRNGFEFPVVAAWGDTITVQNVNEPLQGHLALTGKNRLTALPATLDILLQYIPGPLAPSVHM